MDQKAFGGGKSTPEKTWGDVAMNTDEIRKEALKIEHEILDKIRDFEKMAGVSVDRISVEQVREMGKEPRCVYVHLHVVVQE